MKWAMTLIIERFSKKIYNIGNCEQKNNSDVRLQVYCIKPTRIMIGKVLRI